MDKPGYIDREALADRVRSWIQINHNPDPVLKMQQIRDYEQFLDMIRKTPAADAAQVVHGRWVFDSFLNRRCSKCRGKSKAEPTSALENYCPNCGAKMDLEAKDEH